MAFCGLCGKEIADGEVCSCTTEKQADSPMENVAEKVKKIGGGNKNIIIIAAVAVVVVIVLINLLLGSGGYMEPVDDFVALVNKKNIESLDYENALRPDFSVKYYEAAQKSAMKIEDYAEEIEDDREYNEELFEDMDDEWGKWKLSFEMKSKETMDDDDLEDIQDNIEDYYESMESSIDDYEDILEDADDLEEYADELDVDEKDIKNMFNNMIDQIKALEGAKVTAGYEVKGKFIIKTKDNEYDTGTVKFKVVKVNGDWCYAGTSGDSIDFDLEDEDDVSVNFIESYLNSSYVYR